MYLAFPHKIDIYVYHVILYREIGWLTLSDRRKYQKLVLTYKIFNGQTPNYLLDIFLLNVNARTQYTLRNANDIDLIAHRTELFASSFIPSAIKLWNEFPGDIKSIQSLSSFKSYVMLSFSVSNVPKYYLAGDRILSILHTRNRNNCSHLKFDLFSNGISVHATCGCGYPIEDAEHYLFRCNYYSVQRLKLFQNLRRFHPLSKNALLFGSSELSLKDNLEIFSCVQSYIK